MIILDIESSGLDTGRCGIWQIGAIDLQTKKEFLEEGRIDDEDLVEESALKVTGKTEKELRDRKKQTQKQLILNYLNWVKSAKEKMFCGENVGWDISFIQNKCLRYGIMEKFREVQSQRAIDLHALSQNKWKKIHGEFLLDDRGKSKMNLGATLEFCELPDNRLLIKDGKVEKQGKPHNALDDCKLEGECYSRLTNGKNIFPEFSKFKIPEVLKK